MSANITHMPTESEYLRTTLFFDEEGISTFTVYAMRPLRVKTSALDTVLYDAQESAKKLWRDGHDHELIAQKINHTINTAISELLAKGDGFAGELYQGLDVTAYLGELHTFSYLYSHDGYSFFNPAQFHPGLSTTKH